MEYNISFYRGCNTIEDETPLTECLCNSCNKLDVYDWLQNIPSPLNPVDIVEIRFKNTRKSFFRNVNNLNLQTGDVVAVEANPGHDIGTVSLTGELVLQQLNKFKIGKDTEFKKIYRKAKPTDIEKWHKAIAKEHEAMLKARQISDQLELKMKIGDVEYQGDDTKAIFYYIADDRVDFRSLIKVLADEFKIRIEMRQIGARQEAGRIGGIGSCGRELCCSTWMSNFVSVTTNAARLQELSLNPQKLAGQCGKLKCCLNYELDSYVDAQKDFPSTNMHLEVLGGTAYHQKTDVFKQQMWYSLRMDNVNTLIALHVDRVKEIIALNKKGVIPDKLVLQKDDDADLSFKNTVGQEDINRFKKITKKKRYNKRTRRNKDKGSNTDE